MTKLRVLSFNGIPSMIKGLRPLIWKILLNYIGNKPDKWDQELEEKREIYETYKKMILSSDKYPNINKFTAVWREAETKHDSKDLIDEISKEKGWNKFSKVSKYFDFRGYGIMG